MATDELAANESAIWFLICPRCGLSIKPRADWLTVEYCPRCIARAGSGPFVYLRAARRRALPRRIRAEQRKRDGRSAPRRDRAG
jgi:hypothetical protein